MSIELIATVGLAGCLGLRHAGALRLKAVVAGSTILMRRQTNQSTQTTLPKCPSTSVLDIGFPSSLWLLFN